MHFPDLSSRDPLRYRSPHAEVVPAEEVPRPPAVVGAPAGLVAVVGAVRHPVAAEGEREATTVRAGELGGAAQGDCGIYAGNGSC